MMTASRVVLAGCACLLLLLIPATIATTTESDRIGDAIELTPTDAPNGGYATIDPETGELVLDLSEPTQLLVQDRGGVGVNDGSLTRIDAVFSLAYLPGDDVDAARANVTITTNSSRVNFFIGDDPVHRLTENVTLSQGDRIEVGIEIDVRGAVADVESVETFTIVVQPAAEAEQSESGIATATSGGSLSRTGVAAETDPFDDGRGDTGAEDGHERRTSDDGSVDTPSAGGEGGATESRDRLDSETGTVLENGPSGLSSPLLNGVGFGWLLVVCAVPILFLVRRR